MRIFVAGATGVIGRRLVPLLVAQGHDVTALSRSGRSGAEGVTTVVGDVYDGARLRELMVAAEPDVVMHQLTDLTSRDFAANSRIRREGTRRLVDAALAAGVRRMVTQSIAWAYEPGAGPADESTPLDVHAEDPNRRATVEAVAALETMTAELSEWVVLRYGMLYGPDTWYTKGAFMADLATTGHLPTGRDITSFLHIQDAATAATAALTWPTGPVNVVDDDPAPADAWAPTFADAVGTPDPDHHQPTSPPTTPGPAGGSSSGHVDPRTPWARGATNARARGLGWAPAYPSWRTGFYS
jgi:nucleoside-diphosphate-sugar epimerase